MTNVRITIIWIIVYNKLLEYNKYYNLCAIMSDISESEWVYSTEAEFPSFKSKLKDDVVFNDGSETM